MICRSITPIIIATKGKDVQKFYKMDDFKKKDLLYFEYARISLDGDVISEGTRRVAQTRQNGSDITLEPDASTEERGLRYDIQAVRQKDHVQIRIENMYQILEIILALPDNTRFAYLAVTGSHCEITNIHIGIFIISTFFSILTFFKFCFIIDIFRII